MNRQCLSLLILIVVTRSAAGEWLVPPRNIEPALGARLEQPVVLYDRDPTEPCFADYIPTPKEADTQSKVRLATNEYEPLQFGLYVPSNRRMPLKDISISVHCELPHKIGYLYYERNARRRMLDVGRVYDHRRPRMPLYVIPGDSIAEIQPGRSAAFWVTFGDRHGVEPGVYVASIVISGEGMTPVKRDVEIRVRSFALPRPRIAFGCYYRIDRVPVYFGRHYQELYIRDQAEHGHNCAQIISYFSAFGIDEYQTDGKVPIPEWLVKWQDLFDPSDFVNGVIDPAQFLSEQMEMCRRAGLTHPDIPVFGVQDNPRGPRKAFVSRTIRKLTTRHNWPEILLYMRDEPPAWTGPGFKQEFVDDITQYRRLPDCRSVAAMGGESAAAWGHLHDVWIVLGGLPTPEMVREAVRQRSSVWTYLHDLRITNPVANRYYAGLYTWGLELHGNVPYAYHHGEDGQPHPVYLPGEKRPSREQVMGFILPGPDGPIPGVGYEGRREGIDDYRYLQLLEARIAAAPAHNSLRVVAEEWLSKLRHRVRRAAVRGVLQDFVTLWDLDWMNPDPNVAPRHYRTIREVAAEFIERLPAAPGEANFPPASYDPPASGLEGEEFMGRDLAACLRAFQKGGVKEKRSALSALSLRRVDELAALTPASLVAALDDPDVRIPALRLFRAMGSAAVGVIPAIRQQMKHRDPFVRLHGLLTLDGLGTEAIPVIAESVADTFPGVAVLAAHGLARKGVKAASALPALERALQSPNPRVRRAVVDAIRSIRQD